MSLFSKIAKQNFVLLSKIFINFGALVSGPYHRWDLSNCGAGRLHLSNNCDVHTILLVSHHNRKSLFFH